MHIRSRLSIRLSHSTQLSHHQSPYLNHVCSKRHSSPPLTCLLFLSPRRRIPPSLLEMLSPIPHLIQFSSQPPRLLLLAPLPLRRLFLQRRFGRTHRIRATCRAISRLLQPLQLHAIAAHGLDGGLASGFCVGDFPL